MKAPFCPSKKPRQMTVGSLTGAMRSILLSTSLIALLGCASAQTDGASLGSQSDTDAPPVALASEDASTLTLIFEDEFDTGSMPDPEKWAFDTHANAGGWYNEELQYYGPDNATLEDGALIITARKGAPDEADDYGGQSWSSARLHTKDLFSFTYGRAEARIKVPCGRGLWPAFWMLPEGELGWPEGGEIDIMEYVGHQPDQFYATVHTGAFNHRAGTQVGASRTVQPACGVWHTHRLDWEEDGLTISLNGTPYFTFENDGRGAASWPFDGPFHLLLNMAIGGSWGGAEGVDETAFPARMEVDYVRVWQAPE